MKCVCVQLLFVFIVCQKFVDATKCKPFSKFKIDCDICTCSEDGTKYTCSENDCYKKPQISHNDVNRGYEGSKGLRHFMRRQDYGDDDNMLNDISVDDKSLIDDINVNNGDELDNSNNEGNEEPSDAIQDVSPDGQDFSFLDGDILNNYKLKRSVR